MEQHTPSRPSDAIIHRDGGRDRRRRRILVEASVDPTCGRTVEVDARCVSWRSLRSV